MKLKTFQNRLQDDLPEFEYHLDDRRRRRNRPHPLAPRMPPVERPTKAGGQAAYCNQIFLAQFPLPVAHFRNCLRHMSTVHKTHRLIESFGYCNRSCVGPK